MIEKVTEEDIKEQVEVALDDLDGIETDTVGSLAEVEFEVMSAIQDLATAARFINMLQVQNMEADDE